MYLAIRVILLLTNVICHAVSFSVEKNKHTNLESACDSTWSRLEVTLEAPRTTLASYFKGFCTHFLFGSIGFN